MISLKRIFKRSVVRIVQAGCDFPEFRSVGRIFLDPSFRRRNRRFICADKPNPTVRRRGERGNRRIERLVFRAVRIFARILDICDVGYPIAFNGCIKRKMTLDTLDNFIILIGAGNNDLNFTFTFLNLNDFKRRETLFNRTRRIVAGHNSCILINCTC